MLSQISNSPFLNTIKMEVFPFRALKVLTQPRVARDSTINREVLAAENLGKSRRNFSYKIFSRLSKFPFLFMRL
jgi:hypothetical protein